MRKMYCNVYNNNNLLHLYIVILWPQDLFFRRFMLDEFVSNAKQTVEI